MATITVNTYAFTIVKDNINTWTVTSPASLAGAVSPTINEYSIDEVTYELGSATATAISTVTDYEFTYDADGLYLLEFTGFHATNKYYVLLGNYEDLLTCYRKVIENLLCNNLCDNCYKEWSMDATIVESLMLLLLQLDHYYQTVIASTGTPLLITSIAGYVPDISLIAKLFTRLEIYCTECFQTDCPGC